MTTRATQKFKVGDKVRLDAFGVTGDTGTVVRVGKGTVHTAQHLRIRWDNGNESMVESRKLVLA
jgi:hypothetical protein